MNQKISKVIISCASLLLLTLTGCTSSEKSAPDESVGFTYATVPAGPYLDENPNWEIMALIKSNTKMIALLGGGSSCPPVVETITKSTLDSIQINLKDYGTVPCTADFAITAWEIKSTDKSYDFHDKTIELCTTNACTLLKTELS